MDRHFPARTLVRAAAILSLAAGTAGPALGQRAVNTGNALDSNTQVGSGGWNRPVTNFASDLAFRNAIVTGNVTGGAGFRGEVGYTGAFDFRGDLGGDDLFGFQARSFSSANVLNFHSGLSGGSVSSGMRGLDATQRSLGWGMSGQIVQRQFAGTAASQIDQAIRDPLGGAAGITVDEFTRLQGAIRSTSDLIARSSSEVNRLGMVRNERLGTQSLRVGSDLLAVRDLPLSRRETIDGVRLAPGEGAWTSWRDPLATDPTGRAQDPTLPPGLSNDPAAQLDPRRQQDDGSNPLSNRLPTNRLSEGISPYIAVVDALQTRNERLISGAIDNRAGRPIQPATPGGEPAEPDQPWVLTLEQKLAAVRAALAQSLAEPVAEAPSSTDLGAMIDAGERASRREELRWQLRNATPEERDMLLADPDFVRALTEPSVAADIARETFAGGHVVIKRLIDEPLSPHEQSMFERHMRMGQTLLSEGDYFAAEERFTAALFIVPGDPMAIAGRIHAQIGAGMYRSATLNLSNMIRDYPELAAVRFDASLLPSGKRLEVTLTRLRERTAPTAGASTDAGILLAYMGHQLQQPEDIRRGLDAARRGAAASGQSLAAFVDILSAVWLPEAASGPHAPAEAE